MDAPAPAIGRYVVEVEGADPSTSNTYTLNLSLD